MLYKFGNDQWKIVAVRGLSFRTAGRKDGRTLTVSISPSTLLTGDNKYKLLSTLTLYTIEHYSKKWPRKHILKCRELAKMMIHTEDIRCTETFRNYSYWLISHIFGNIHNLSLTYLWKLFQSYVKVYIFLTFLKSTRSRLFPTKTIGMSSKCLTLKEEKSENNKNCKNNTIYK